MGTKKIIALIDYKGKFGSKHFDRPYRSGMDKSMLTKLFNENDFDIQFEYFHKVDIRNKEKYTGIPVLYTSSEDIGYHYKSYIEDVVFGLEQIGAKSIPDFKYLRANNNKVFMEFLRTSVLNDYTFYSKHYGSMNDVLMDVDQIAFPVVLKKAEGASGADVFLVNNKKDLIVSIRKIKDFRYYKEDVKDYLRSLRHKGYQRESTYRNRFIIQPFISGLRNDWKVYVFHNKIYVFKRPILKNRDIRASGGGYDNYFYGLDAAVPDGMLEYAFGLFEKFNVPNISLDIAWDGHKFYLIEFQALYFGTAGIPYSDGYFDSTNNFKFEPVKLYIEEVYCNSIVSFLNR